ncbi:MAG: TRAP transporter large permease subunit, partial [Rhodospirillaceae bacterium]
MIRFKINPALGPRVERISLSQKWASLSGVRGIVILIVLVMGSIYSGIATPTEAAAVGAIGAMVMAIPRMKGKDFWHACLETARTTSLIFAIVAGVLIYVHFLGFTGMPAAVSEWILALNMPTMVVLICILLMYLFLGMFLDGIGMLLLTVPIILPTIKALGVDPIVFGVLVVRMIEIGLITPPVGLNVYVLKGVARDVSMGDMFKGCGWFVLVDVINVAILLSFPQLITFIPSTMIK